MYLLQCKYELRIWCIREYTKFVLRLRHILQKYPNSAVLIARSEQFLEINSVSQLLVRYIQ